MTEREDVLKKYSIILVGTEEEANIGFTARVMANFGLESLILVDPQCEITNFAFVLARHAKQILENIEVVNTLAGLKEKFDTLVGTSARISHKLNPWRFAYPIKEIIPNLIRTDARIGFVFGRESKGLSNLEIDMLDFIVTIPTSEHYPVLNLSHAVGVVAYEIFQNSSIPKKRVRAGDSHRKEILLNYVSEVLSLIQYPEFKRPILLRIFKNVVGRSMITMRELFTLLGFFRRIRNRLR